MPTYAVRAPSVPFLPEQRTTGTWESAKVTPASSTTACRRMLFAMSLVLGFLRRGAVARPLVAAINTAAMDIDTHSAGLREPGLGGVFANSHIVGETPR